jgi:hypothetical protein
MSFLDIVILVVIAVAVIISLIYVTKGAISIAKIDNYEKDPNLALAHRYLSWTSATCWSLITLLVVGFILTLIFGPELIFIWGGVLIGGLMLVLIAFAIATGVLSSMSAYNISISKLSKDPNAQSAYIDSIVAAVVSLGVIGLLGIAFIIYFTRKYRRDQELAQAQKNLRDLRTEEYVDKLLDKGGSVSTSAEPSI